MELTTESRQHIEHVAGEALTQLDSIAAAAKSKLHDGRTLGSDALASINTMTSSSAIQKLDQISQANRESYQVLAAEPAIARVVVVDEEGEEIGRGTGTFMRSRIPLSSLPGYHI